MTHHRSRSIAALTTLTLLSPVALAGGPALSGMSAQADSAETAISNPAGMARLDEATFTVRTVVGEGLGEFKVDENRTTMDGGDPDSNFAPVILPMLFYVRPLGERWRAGISLTIPTGFGADYGSDWAGRYYSDYYTLVYVALTPALSYRVNDKLSLGVATNINYTLSETEVPFNNPGADVADGRLKAELDGIGSSFSLSMLWEATEHTRYGLVYTSEAQADLEGDLKFRNLGPVLESVLQQQGLLDSDIKVENTLPQRISGGMYHEFESGASFSIDAMWMEFSEFGTSSVSLNGSSLEIDENGAFDDFWGMSVGWGFPACGRLRWSVGAFYTSAPVDDDERSLSLALDRMWGVGAGVHVTRQGGRSIDLNANIVDYGEAPVDTGDSPYRGRVVGKTDNPYALMFDASFHF